LKEKLIFLDSNVFGEITPDNLSSIVHREGINCRHLGRVRIILESDVLKKIFLTEIVARTLVYILFLNS
jgi:hypothetical protein